MRSKFNRVLRAVLLTAFSAPIAVASVAVGPVCFFMGALGLTGGLADTSRWENTIVGLEMLAVAAVIYLASGLWFFYGLPKLWKAA